MSRDDGEDGFLGRWSRRKRLASRTDAVEEAPAESDVPERGETPEPAPLEPETDEAILARLDLPDPDTLEAGDDFSRYLRAPLPQHLKQRALRRLWRSNPVLANLDGLNDYDTDFTGDTVPLGTLKTAYQVGRGFAARALEATTGDTAVSEAPAAPEPAAEAAQAEPAGVAEADTAEDGPDPRSPRDTVSSAEPAEVRTRRRMAFRFET